VYIRRLKTGTYEFFKRLEKGGDASCNNDAQHRVTKNPSAIVLAQTLDFPMSTRMLCGLAKNFSFLPGSLS
jgi:hypothetical protein